GRADAPRWRSGLGGRRARLPAAPRRGRSRHLQSLLSYGPIELDQQSRRVTVDSQPMILSNTEFRLLHYLMLHAETPVSRDELALHASHAPPARRSTAID